MSPARRRLVAIDDPLTLGTAATAPDRSRRRELQRTAALYVQLPIEQSESLRRAAFELRVHKRILVAALISAHVDADSDAGLAALRRVIAQHDEPDTSDSVG
jgi:hypothetical protein